MKTHSTECENALFILCTSIHMFAESQSTKPSTLLYLKIKCTCALIPNVFAFSMFLFYRAVPGVASVCLIHCGLPESALYY